MAVNIIPNFLRAAADAELARLEGVLPPDAEWRFLLFLEIQRVFDTACVQQAMLDKKDHSVEHHLDILRWGMNLATALLLAPIKTSYALPLIETSDAFRTDARNLLWNFGAVSLAWRTADMVQQKFLLAEQDGKSINLRDSGTGPVQYMDHAEIALLRRSEAAITKDKISPQGWAICRPEDIKDKLKVIGNYFAHPPEHPGPLLQQKELQEHMLPLIFPWRTPQGTMIGYGASEEVDAHFLMEVQPIINDFKLEAGIHPDVDFGDYSGSDVLIVTTVLLSFFRKHVAFVLLARRHFPEISMRESLTIWGPIDGLLESVHLASQLPKNRVEAVLKSLTLTTEDLKRLKNETTPLLPMLIDLGNGFYLKPASCLTKNPLSAFLKIAQWRNPSTRNLVSSSRESWFRQDLYSLFAGSRYWCVPGNIVLRHGRKRLTDVDAAVFDRTTGELTLFQLKWQDYSTNNISELRSKASNLASEVDAWGERVMEWISTNPPQQVAKALRLKIRGKQGITALFLVGVSRSIARTQGYGFPLTNPYLSIATWSQFQRVRGEIGPAPRVLSKIHELLRDEEQLSLANVKPHPATVQLRDFTMHFEDLWTSWDDGDVKGEL